LALQRSLQKPFTAVQTRQDSELLKVFGVICSQNDIDSRSKAGLRVPQIDLRQPPPFGFLIFEQKEAWRQREAPIELDGQQSLVFAMMIETPGSAINDPVARRFVSAGRRGAQLRDFRIACTGSSLAPRNLELFNEGLKFSQHALI
jgi:hypothetical protein